MLCGRIGHWPLSTCQVRKQVWKHATPVVVVILLCVLYAYRLTSVNHDERYGRENQREVLAQLYEGISKKTITGSAKLSVVQNESSKRNENIAASISFYDGRYEKPTRNLLLNISTDPDTDRKIETLRPIAIPFLPNYKSPCWYESVPDLTAVYAGSPYTAYRDKDGALRRSFDSMQQVLQHRAHQEGFAWRLRCLPYFYVVGAPRCGTTDIYSSLVQHKQIPLTSAKESVYWNRVRYMMPSVIGKSNLKLNYSLPVSIRHFLDLNDGAAEEVRLTTRGDPKNDPNRPPEHSLIIGDMSPSYMYDFDAWDQLPLNRLMGHPRYVASDLIKTVTPSAKIIFILRNPIDRLLSDYNFFQSRKTKRTLLGFDSLVRMGLQLLNSCLQSHKFMYCVHDRDTNIPTHPLRMRIGLYYPFMQEWFNVFQRNQILVLRFEDYAKDKKTALRTIFNFLHIEQMSEETLEDIVKRDPRNRSEGDDRLTTMLNSTRQLLNNFYAPWNRKLAIFLQDNRFLWSEA